MRIGQLARRLGITPSDILGFLSGQTMETELGANSRLTQEMTAKVINRFAPGRLSEIMTAPAEEPVAEIPAEKPLVDEKTEVIEETRVVETPRDEIADEETPAGPQEVIRVAKVELQGLKVLGKIDLPQPKKKGETPAEGEETTSDEGTPEPVPAAPQRAPRKEFQKRNDRREPREWENPLEQKRRREQEEAEKKKREHAERQKEKRANHYYSKVKSVPTKAARRIEEQTVVEELDMKEPPKTILGKFFRWLRA
jgi:hypothetical protein